MTTRLRGPLLAGLTALAAAGALDPVPLAAQEQRPGSPFASSAVAFAVSPPLRVVAATEAPQFGAASIEDDLVSTKPIKTLPGELLADVWAPSLDDAKQSSPAVEPSTPSPSGSFAGISSADNQSVYGFRIAPPDTVGDVGPSHYVQAVNNLMRVYDKAGNPLTSVFKMSSLFTALGTACSLRDNGDPIVLYDPLADRWLVSQFCTLADPNNHQMIGVSQTGDPTGAYFLYDFTMPNNKFNDYPKFGVWPDAYYMTDNQYNQAQTMFQGAGVYAFDRAKMLLGDPGANFVYFDLSSNKGGMLPADLDGSNPPPLGQPCYFAQYLSTIQGDGVDGLRIFEFHADFATPGNSTFAERADSPVAVAAFDPRNPNGRNDIEQPPAVSVNVDSIQDRLMFRLQYRNFGSHESLVATHTVNVSGFAPIDALTHQSGIRYYEVRRSLPGGPFSVNEQATFAPDLDNRWMGSAAMDTQGNLAVAYSVSSLTTFPSIRYAARLATDPPGGLFQGETTLIAGTGVQRSTGGRWGDYSAMSVDPADDCTFWYTTEYYTAASQATSTVGWLTRIGSFKLPSCNRAPRAVDFDGGGKSDVLWHHSQLGAVYEWAMDGPHLVSQNYVGTVSDTNWEIKGYGDQTGDGKADLLWRNKLSGGVYLWPMDGFTLQSQSFVGAVDPAYEIAGFGDYDGDGKSDVLWRHKTLGDTWVWLMDGATKLSQTYLASPEPDYEVVGSGDFNGDGKADVLWRHKTVGAIWIWLMNGSSPPSASYVGTVDPGYEVIRASDFDGGGKADVLWRHKLTGDIWIWSMNGVTPSPCYVGVVNDLDWEIVASGDYDGDGKSDLLWHHRLTGGVFQWRMNGCGVQSQSFVGQVSDTDWKVVRLR